MADHAKKSLTEKTRLVIALTAAGYMRWVETRKGHTPTSEMMQGYIAGQLDNEGFAYTPDDLQTIEIGHCVPH